MYEIDFCEIDVKHVHSSSSSQQANHSVLHESRSDGGDGDDDDRGS